MNSCLSNWKANFNSKNVRERCFSIETKTSISFIPIRRMHLWCLIIKRKEIIMWIRVCPNRRMNINYKNGRKRCFSYETKAWISFIPTRRMCLWCLITKKMRLLCESMFVQIDELTLIIKMVQKNFSYETKASIH